MADEFGDVEPEDAWDPGDTVAEQIENLVRRGMLLEPDVLIPRGDPGVTLDALADLVRLARTRQLTERERVRANDLDDDIKFITRRL
jgi:hypothetical protein